MFLVNIILINFYSGKIFNLLNLKPDNINRVTIIFAT